MTKEEAKRVLKEFIAADVTRAPRNLSSTAIYKYADAQSKQVSLVREALIEFFLRDIRNYL